MPEALLNGVRLVYQTQGEGPPVLLICGTGQAAAMWGAGGVLPAVLDTGCSAITYDNRGIPPSDCPAPPWTVGDMAEDAIALIDYLEVGPCHILGASLGALIAQTVALRRPDLVKTATFLVGGGNFCRSAQLALQGQVELLRQGIEFPEPMQQANLLEATLTQAQRQDDDVVDRLLGLTQQLTHSFGPGGQYGQLSADATWASEDHLQELVGLSAPCLVIAAEHDVYFPPALLQRAAALIPDATYVEIPGSAHVTTDPNAGAVAADAIAEFLRSGEARGLAGLAR